MAKPTQQEVIDQLEQALRDLEAWCYDNVPYFPDGIALSDQNSGEEDQPHEDTCQAIAGRVTMALEAAEKLRKK